MFEKIATAAVNVYYSLLMSIQYDNYYIFFSLKSSNVIKIKVYENANVKSLCRHGRVHALVYVCVCICACLGARACVRVCACINVFFSIIHCLATNLSCT